MMERIVYNIADLSKTLKDLLDIFEIKICDDKKISKRIGEKIKIGILVRTAKGRGPDGYSLPPYGGRWLAYRKRMGRPTAWRDLFFSGQMLMDLDVKTNGTSSELYFKSAEQAKKAYEHNFGVAEFRLPATHFLESSDNELTSYVKDIAEELMADALRALQ